MIVRTLPNGQLVALMTPREALFVCDQVLEPATLVCQNCLNEVRKGFPWQHEEGQIVAMDFKMKVREQLQAATENTLMHAAGQIQANDEAVRHLNGAIKATQRRLREAEDSNDGDRAAKYRQRLLQYRVQLDQLAHGVPEGEEPVEGSDEEAQFFEG